MSDHVSTPHPSFLLQRDGKTLNISMKDPVNVEKGRPCLTLSGLQETSPYNFSASSSRLNSVTLVQSSILREALMVLPYPLILLRNDSNASTCVVFANGSFCRMFGTSEKEYIEETLDCVLPSSVAAVVSKIISNFSPGTLSLKSEVFEPDLPTVNFIKVYRLLHVSESHFVVIFSSSLEGSEDDAISDYVSAPYFVVDPKGNMMEWNQEMARVSGFPREEVITACISELAKNEQSIRAAVDRVLFGYDVPHFRVCFELNSRVCELDTHITPLMHASTVIGAVFTVVPPNRLTANPEILPLLRSFVPRLVAEKYALDSALPTSAEEQLLSGALLHADISGFTAMGEQWETDLSNGAEKIGTFLNDVYRCLVPIVTSYGGDIIFFAGDALVAVFQTRSDRPLEAVTWHAARCAQDLLRAEVLHDMAVMKVKMKMTMASGTMAGWHVGGVDNRWEFLLAGEPVIEIAKAQNDISSGQLVLSRTAFSLVEEHITVESSFSAEGVDFVRVSDVCACEGSFELPAVPLTANAIRHALTAYVPQEVLPFLNHRITWLTQMRVVSVVFMQVTGIDYSGSGLMSSNIRKLQHAFAIIQVVLRDFGGSIIRFRADEKGLVLHCAFGLPGLWDRNFTLRAVLAACLMRQHLMEMHLIASLGVTTGYAFIGYVGNSTRQEYAQSGDVVNTSARLMGAANAEVLCDWNTYRSCAVDSVAFTEVEPIIAKGKAAKVAVYRATLKQSRNLDELMGSTVIYRLLPYFSSGVLNPQVALCGRSDELDIVAQSYESTFVHQYENATLLIFQGGVGCGKSTFLRQLYTMYNQPDDASKPTVVILQGFYLLYRHQFNYLQDVFKAMPFAIQNTLKQRLKPLVDELTFGFEAPFVANRASPKSSFPFIHMLRQRYLLGKSMSARQVEQAAAVFMDCLGTWVAELPGLMLICDDMHLCDDASKNFLCQIIGTIPKLFVVGATWQHDNTLWVTDSTQMCLMPSLSSENMVEFVTKKLQLSSPPAQDFSDWIQDRAKNNALVSEILLVELISSNALRCHGGEATFFKQFVGEQNLLPDRLLYLRVWQLDRLSLSKQITLMVASVIGNIFPVALLEHIFLYVGGNASLHADLQWLENAGYIQPTSDPQLPMDAITPATKIAREYQFKKQQLDKVAYGLVLLTRRRELHTRIAQWFEQNQLTMTTAMFSKLAYHWEKAGYVEKNLYYKQKEQEATLDDSTRKELARLQDLQVELQRQQINLLKQLSSNQTLLEESELVSKLGAMPLFAHLNSRKLATMASLFKPEQLMPLSHHPLTIQYQAGHGLLREGESMDRFFIILKGSVELRATDARGQEVVLAVRGVGEPLNEMAMVSETPSMATIVTREPCVIASLLSGRFRAFLQGEPELLSTFSDVIETNMLSRLKMLPLFDTLSDKNLMLLSALLTFQSFPARKEVPRQINNERMFYLIIRGAVSILGRMNEESGLVELDVRRAGSHLGELFGSDDSDGDMVQFQAVEDTLLLAINQQQLNHFMALAPEMAEEVKLLAQQRIVSFLASFPLFAPLPHRTLRLLLPLVQIMNLGERIVIFHEGDPCTKFFLILNGHVELSTVGPTGAQYTLAEATIGEYFGEMELLSHASSYAMTATTTRQCLLLAMTQDAFEQLVRSEPKLSVDMKEIGCTRLAQRFSILPLFHSLSADMLNLLVSNSKIIYVPAGEAVFQEGQDGDTFYVVLSNFVEVHAASGSRKQVFLCRRVVGECFGEFAVLHNSVRTATVSCTKPTLLLTLQRQFFHRFFNLVPGFKEHVETVSVERLVSRVRLVPLFSVLDDTQLLQLVQQCNITTLKPGDALFVAGGQCVGLHLVIEGQLRVHCDKDGVVHEIGVTKSGEYLGIVDLFDDTFHATSATAQGPAVVITLPREHFTKFLRLAPHLEQEIRPSTNIYDCLRGIPMFSKVSEDAMQLLVSLFSIQRFTGQQTVFMEGSHGDSFYVIISGEVEVRASGTHRSNALLDVLHPGAAFGELALLEAVPRTATLRTVGKSTLLLVLTRDAFSKVLDVIPDVGDQIRQMAMSRLISRLKCVPLFNSLSDEQLDVLRQLTKFESLDEGATLFSEGDYGTKFYIVFSGRLGVYARGADGDEVLLAERSVGMYFGEMSLLEDGFRTASLRTIDKSTLLSLTRESFTKFLALVPGMEAEFRQVRLQRLASRLAVLPLFAGVAEVQLEVLAALFQLLRLDTGTAVFLQGDVGDAFFVIMSGEVVVKHTDSYGTRELGTRKEGECFGEISLLTSEPRTATIETKMPCIFLMLTRSNFDTLCLVEPSCKAHIEQLARTRLITVSPRPAPKAPYSPPPSHQGDAVAEVSPAASPVASQAAARSDDAVAAATVADAGGAHASSPPAYAPVARAPLSPRERRVTNDSGGTKRRDLFLSVPK